MIKAKIGDIFWLSMTKDELQELVNLLNLARTWTPLYAQAGQSTITANSERLERAGLIEWVDNPVRPEFSQWRLVQ